MSHFEQKQISMKKLIPTSQISQEAQSNTTNFTTDTITDTNSTRMAVSNGITNKEALKDKIHDIHNYLRNHGAGYGMNALKVFNILYGLKKIEDKGLHESVGLTEESRFSNLLNLANKNKDEEIATLIFSGVLTSIFRSKIKDLLFYEIPKNIRGSVFAHLIKEINLVAQIEVSCNVLLSGKIYEYFIGRDESAISELGAYFTDRHIVDYIYDKLNPEMCENGTIHSMIDMFGGSGGFTTGYIDNLNLKYPELVKWETEINKIYHYDMNEDVIKSAGLEFFCLTGVLPNMINLKYKNSFTDEFIDEATNSTKKYHYVITNPPYGGDKSNKSEAQVKRNKTKEYIKKELLTITDEDIRRRRHLQLKNLDAKEKLEKNEGDKTKVSISMCSGRIQKFAKDNSLAGNDKEACSLMLMMDLLEVDGTSIGVLKEGVIFNKAYKNLRKCLIANYNVREVISVPADQFENTKTKTSIVIFDNTIEKTTVIKFSDLLVNRYEEDIYEEINGDIYLVQNKGDIMGISDSLVSNTSYEELLKNPIYSLNGKDYKKSKMEVGDGYDLKKIGDICKLDNGFAFKTNEYEKVGIPLLTITHIPNFNFKTCKYITESKEYAKFIVKKNDILIALTGNDESVGTYGMYLGDEIVYCNQRVAKITNNELMNKYMYFIFEAIQIKAYITGNGSVQKNVSSTDIEELFIPVPKTKERIQDWVDKISKPYNENNEKQARVNELEADIQNRIKEITENEECDEVELGSVCVVLPTTKHYTNISKKEGLYKFYNSSQESNLYVDFCEVLEESIIIGQGGIVSIHFDKNFTPSKHVCVLQHRNRDTDELRFIYKSLMSVLSDFVTNGSVIQWLNKTNIKNTRIKIPRNKKIITDMDYMFQEIETLQTGIKNADELYKQYIQELGNESKQSNIIANNKESNVVIIEQVQEPIIKIRKIKKKITV